MQVYLFTVLLRCGACRNRWPVLPAYCVVRLWASRSAAAHVPNCRFRTMSGVTFGCWLVYGVYPGLLCVVLVALCPRWCLWWPSTRVDSGAASSNSGTMRSRLSRGDVPTWFGEDRQGMVLLEEPCRVTEIPEAPAVIRALVGGSFFRIRTIANLASSNQRVFSHTFCVILVF